MILIPNWLVISITFPGLLIYIWVQKFFCKLAGIKVHRTRYLKLDSEEFEFIKHDQPETFKQSFLISFGPFIINSLIAISISFALAMIDGLFKEKQYLILLFLFGFWLSMSIAMHALPKNHDASLVIQSARNSRLNGGSIFYNLVIPIMGLLYIINIMRFLWFDVVYAAYVGKFGFYLYKLTQNVYY